MGLGVAAAQRTDHAMRRVLLSFLGTGSYAECNYHDGNDSADGVRYVAEALAQLRCADWTANDRILVFATDGARQAHWLPDPDAGRDPHHAPPRRLKASLERLRDTGTLCAGFECVPIDDLSAGVDLWSIFSTISSQLHDDDHILFDVTLGYRAFPLLALVLVSYLRVVRKRLTVDGIVYAAFDAVGTRAEPAGSRNVPFIDLMPFVELMDWSRAVDGFVSYGDAGGIRRQINASGTAEDATLKQLVRELTDLTENIHASRGSSLVHTLTLPKLAGPGELSGDIAGGNAALTPLLERVQDKVAGFSGDPSVANGYGAVQWCIDHDLIPQGYAILQETVRTDLLKRAFGDEFDPANLVLREYLDACIQARTRKDIEPRERQALPLPQQEKIRSVVEGLHQNFLGAFDGLRDARNDISHAGYRNQPATPNGLRKRLKNALRRLRPTAAPPSGHSRHGT